MAAPDAFANDVAAFIRTLQAIDPADGPRPGRSNFGRGAPLSQWRDVMRERMVWLADIDDIHDLTAAWEEDSGATPYGGPGVWLHGDLSAGNLLERGGRLAGVIDWSSMGVGDPACELQVAWDLFDHAERLAFRTAIAVDDATWRRGRAWGLAVGVLNLSYYRTRSRPLADQGRRTIDAVLADRVRER